MNPQEKSPAMNMSEKGPELPLRPDIESVFQANAEAFGGSYTEAGQIFNILDGSELVATSAFIYDPNKTLVRYVTYRANTDRAGSVPTMEYRTPTPDGAPGAVEAVLEFRDGEWVGVGVSPVEKDFDSDPV